MFRTKSSVNKTTDLDRENKGLKAPVSDPEQRQTGGESPLRKGTQSRGLPVPGGRAWTAQCPGAGGKGQAESCRLITPRSRSQSVGQPERLEVAGDPGEEALHGRLTEGEAL